WTACHPTVPLAPHAGQPVKNGFEVHRRSSLAWIVLRSMNCAMASAGMRTARPQFTRGSLRLASHALTVQILTFNASAASATVSRFLISPSVAHDMFACASIGRDSNPWQFSETQVTGNVSEKIRKNETIILLRGLPS